jgi:hypothetical protein
MKMKIALVVMSLMSFAAMADSTTATQQGQQQQTATNAAATNAGNAQTLVQNAAPGVAYSGQYNVKTAPTMGAPGLTTTLTETCMGSSSGGVSVMGFGISGGSTWKDEECIRRLNSRELAQTLHEYDAAKELLCGNPEINEVYKVLGRPCLMSASVSTVLPGGAQAEWRDPVNPRPAYISPNPPANNVSTNSNREPTKEEAAAILKAKLQAAEEARVYMQQQGYLTTTGH